MPVLPKRHLKPIRAIYGNTTILRMICPKCKQYALVVAGKFLCCNLAWTPPDKLRSKKKRMCEASDRRSQPSNIDKLRILEYQNNQCLYCGATLGSGVSIEYDHFQPYSFSGSCSGNVFVAACSRCNGLKSSLMFRSVEDARIHICSSRQARGLPIHEYLGADYDIAKNEE